MASIYIASKTRHADRWRVLRDYFRVPIISRWIDLDANGAIGDWTSFWQSCFGEISYASALLLYFEDGEELKGALAEVGVALSYSTTVYVVTTSDNYANIFKHNCVKKFASFQEAFRAMREDGILRQDQGTFRL